MVMKQVRIAELKAKLSEFLRTVQGGESIAVFDRNTAIAQIVPICATHDRALGVAAQAHGLKVVGL